MTATEIAEVEKELEESYLSFFRFSITLLEELSETNNNLIFAIVNVQICLELFIKYYLVKTGNWNRAISISGSKRKYKDYSDVLKGFFSVNRKPYLSRKQLNQIGENRNAIVHRGQSADWNQGMVEMLFLSILFIQGTMMDEFQKSLLKTAYPMSPNKLLNNLYWLDCAIKFADSLRINHAVDVWDCAFCEARAFVPKEAFGFDETDTTGFQCLACFEALDTEFEAHIINCPHCRQTSYMVEALNQQKNQEHLGKCLNCRLDFIVKKCHACEKYYFPDFKDSYQLNGIFYCSTACSAS